MVQSFDHLTASHCSCHTWVYKALFATPSQFYVTIVLALLEYVLLVRA